MKDNQHSEALEKISNKYEEEIKNLKREYSQSQIEFETALESKDGFKEVEQK